MEAAFSSNAVTLELHDIIIITIISSTFSPHDISFNRMWWYYVYILNNQASRPGAVALHSVWCAHLKQWILLLIGYHMVWLML